MCRSFPLQRPCGHQPPWAHVPSTFQNAVTQHAWKRPDRGTLGPGSAAPQLPYSTPAHGQWFYAHASMMPPAMALGIPACPPLGHGPWAACRQIACWCSL